MLSKSCRIKRVFNSLFFCLWRFLGILQSGTVGTMPVLLDLLFQKALVITLRWVFEKLHKAAGGTSVVNRSLEKQRAAW